VRKSQPDSGLRRNRVGAAAEAHNTAP
jgi:hypothetical protein